MMIAILSAPFPRKAGKLLVVDAVFGLYMLDLEKVTFDTIIHHDHQYITIIIHHTLDGSLAPPSYRVVFLTGPP